MLFFLFRALRRGLVSQIPHAPIIPPGRGNPAPDFVSDCISNRRAPPYPQAAKSAPRANSIYPTRFAPDGNHSKAEHTGIFAVRRATSNHPTTPHRRNPHREFRHQPATTARQPETARTLAPPSRTATPKPAAEATTAATTGAHRHTASAAPQAQTSPTARRPTTAMHPNTDHQLPNLKSQCLASAAERDSPAISRRTAARPDAVLNDSSGIFAISGRAGIRRQNIAHLRDSHHPTRSQLRRSSAPRPTTPTPPLENPKAKRVLGQRSAR